MSTSTASPMTSALGVVAGLVNFGNTCYANALLQALASCETYYEYMQNLVKTIPLTQNVETRDENGQLLNWKTYLPLSRSIASCLERLQPNYAGRQLLASALEVLHGIGLHDRRLFSGSGEQQDVGEVLDCLASASQVELTAWSTSYLSSNKGLSLRDEPAVTEDDASIHPRILRNGTTTAQLVSPQVLPGWAVEQFRSDGCFDGWLSHRFECCSCGHIFDTQLNPFKSLPLPIPTYAMDSMQFSLEREVSLHQCLREYFSEKQQGPICCPKCSFSCTIAHDASMDGTASGYRRDQSVYSASGSSADRSSMDEDINNGDNSWRRSNGLSDLLTDSPKGLPSMGGVVYRASASFDLKEFENNVSKQNLSPTAKKKSAMKDILTEAREAPFHDAHVRSFKRRLQAIGIRWIPCDSDVRANTKLAKLPKVLPIALQRKVFDGVGYRKIEGRVSYPLILDVAEFVQFQSVHSTVYRLKAVLVHHGNEVGGHYLTARSIKTPDGASFQWVLASDDKVYYVAENAALGLEASMLIYERETVEWPESITGSIEFY